MSSGNLLQTTARGQATVERTSRPASRQATELARWLETKTGTIAEHPSVAAPRRAVVDAPSAGSRMERLAARKDLVKPLRDALAEQGLAVLPDPLHRFPCAKVVRVSDLL